MEHLRRNTNNERIISIIQASIKKQENAYNKNMDIIMMRINNLFTAILAYLVTNFFVNPLFTKNTAINKYIEIILSITFFIIFWYIFSKILKYFEKKLNEKVDINKPIDIINSYNTEIIPTMAEIHEALSVSITTSDIECKLMNLVTSLYKWKNIIWFFKYNFILEKGKGTDLIRKTNDIKCIELIDKYLNIYSIDSTIVMLDTIHKNLQNLLNDEDVINSINKKL